MHGSRAIMLELGTLIRRDHDDLHYALRVMSEPLSDQVHVRAKLAQLCVMFPAHAEAEVGALTRALGEVQPPPAAYLIVSQITAAHLAQETALRELACLDPRSTPFRERARFLRAMMLHHGDHEVASVNALAEHMPREVYRSLANAYALERARLLEAPPLRHVG